MLDTPPKEPAILSSDLNQGTAALHERPALAHIIDNRDAFAQAIPPRAQWLRLLLDPQVLVWTLAVLFLGQAITGSVQKSAAYDEPFHIASGLAYLQSGRIVRPSDHPPLVRELSGLALYAQGVRLPQSAATEALLRGEGGDLEYGVGSALLAQSDPQRVLLWARLPLMLLGGLFVLCVYGFAKSLLGQRAGLCAAAFCAFDPLVLSNFSIVYTDAAFALCTLLTLWALWEYVRSPGWWRILLCGLALGAALGSKSSAVALLPVIVMLLAAARLWPEANGAKPKGAWLERLPANYTVGFCCMGLTALCVLLYLFLWPSDPGFYLKGLAAINGSHNTQYMYYLGGEYSSHFKRYYVEAWLLKEPLATVLFCAIGTVALARAKRVSRLACLFLFVPALVLLAGYSLLSDDLGVRYLVPVLPFTLIVAGAGAAAMWAHARWSRIACVVGLVWLVAASAGVYPDHMHYFNEAACLLTEPARLDVAGGTACGPAWLDDSNVDSGQGLVELRRWIALHATGQRVYLGYFGSVPPAVFGVSTQPGDYQTVLRGTDPGLYAVSAHIVARAHSGPGSGGGDWLLQERPIAFVGHTYFIYQVR